MLRKKLRLTCLMDGINPHANFGTSSSEGAANGTANVDTTKSKYFEVSDSSIASTILQLERDLNKSLRNLTFKDPVRYIYNPIEYAYIPHASYVEKYCQGEKKVLLLGMNPGPWGMCQTGVPFGEINLVRDWFKINGAVSTPDEECPGKEIVGFACHRSEESGKRLIGYFKKICVTPDNFFKHSFMHNYCPLAFMRNNGANVTPSDLKGQIRCDLEELCNATLFEIIRLLNLQIIIGIGRYAESQVKRILQQNNYEHVKVIYMPHPSPRVVGNENWHEKAEAKLKEEDLMKYFKNE